MNVFRLEDHPHRRQNILTGEWILVSPQRARRPWQGQVEDTPPENLPAYDPACYLCPGNIRAGGLQNPRYENTYVFDNDFSALLPDTPGGEMNKSGLLQAHSEKGICRVICFSPRHDLTLPQMEVADIRRVVEVWAEEYRNLGSIPGINSVLIFENKGQMMGCSNPHPHGQIWAQQTPPMEIFKESRQMAAFYKSYKKSLLESYLEIELQEKERLVAENDHFAALTPFWAVWPFETIIISRRAIPSLLEMTDNEKTALAAILKQLTQKYDRLFNMSFPYSAGIHQSPTDGEAHPDWHFHVHFYPPLLRSATIKKFMVGYEMLGNPQRDITAEFSAAKLREL